MNRLIELRSFDILDTDPEIEMNEIAEMAKAIFNTPISVVSFMDDHRQWYKAKIGVKWNEVPLEDTFCRFTLDSPDETLLILDPLTDERVHHNPYVSSADGIRFYVSAPIVSFQGNVLGTVCVWDHKKHEVKEAQLQALKLLAKRVAISLETRKLLKDQHQKIELFGQKLQRLTELSPGAMFKLKTDPSTKNIKLDFLSSGISRLLPEADPDEILSNPTIFLNWINPNLRFSFLRQFIHSSKCNSPFEMDIPVSVDGKSKIWLWIKARPEFEDGEINYYGTIQDISQKVAHVKSLKKFLFDISHKLRAPVAKIKGVIHLIRDENSAETTMEMIPFLYRSIEELDHILHKLNIEYSELIDFVEEDT